MTPRTRSLRGRLAAVFAVLALALVVAGVLAVSAFNQLLDGRRQLVDRADPALAATDRLTTDLVDQETGVRGYALGRQASFLEPYMRGRADQARVVGQLRVHAAALPGATALLDDVLTRAEAWRTRTAEPTIAAVRRGDSSRRAKVLAPAGKRRFDAIRTAIAALERRIDDLRARARHRLDSDTTRLQSAIGGGLILVVLVGILL
ncbi:MAG: histidine kinase, partial [Solirubrobacteraceae bacterium]|nr:histidine kinase [Solirubrobacteraceae bacterium]